MAGRPRTRARKLAESLGIPYEDALAQVMGEDPGPGRGASPERMAELTAIRMEKAKTDPAAKGGRPSSRLTPEQIEEALRRNEPRALRVLERQLSSKDERVAQRAAQLLLEWRRGKPTSTVKQELRTAGTVRYEAAAWRPTLVEPPSEDAGDAA